MAVLAVWQCDRDGTMFQDKKAAEEYDKMLELAENISALIEKLVPDVNAQHNESIGLLLAKHRETLAKACKGKPELLLEDLDALGGSEEATSEGSADTQKVTPIKAKG